MIEELIRRLTKLERAFEGLIKPEVGGWKDWTPTVTQGGAVAVTVNFARYTLDRNTVHLWAKLTATGAGTAPNGILVQNLPYAPAFHGARIAVGSHIIQDATVAIYDGTVEAIDAVNLRFYYNGGVVGNNPNFSLAAGDIIGFKVAYERA